MAKYWLVALLTISAVVYSVGAQHGIVSKELQNFFPLQMNKSNFTLETAKDLLYKKCKKVLLNGTAPPETLYENLENAAQRLSDCVNDIANVTAVLEEMEAARPTGDLDLVIIKYCAKVPQVKQCLDEFNEQLLVCLSATERAHNAIMMHVITSLLDAVCLKNGDPIALFIAEDGPECLDANKENILNCMNASFSGYLPKDIPSELPELVVGRKECIDFHDFERCVVSYMETCNEVTPAGIVESLFRYVRRETICQEEIEKATAASVIERNGAFRMELRRWSIGITMMVLVFNLFVKYLY